MESDTAAGQRQIFRSMCIFLSINFMCANAWIAPKVASLTTDNFYGTDSPRHRCLATASCACNNSLKKHRRSRGIPSVVRLFGSSSENFSMESSTAVKINELNDMDVVVYSLFDDDDEKKIYLGALQEDGVLSPLSAWTDEPAFGDSIEFLVDEVDRFTLKQQTDNQRQSDEEGSDSGGEENNSIKIHHLLTEAECSYGARQCPRGVHNPHGEESELLYYIDQEVIERFEIPVEIKPELEILW